MPGATEPLEAGVQDADGAVKKVASSFRYVPDGKLKTTKQKLLQFVSFHGAPPLVYEVVRDENGGLVGEEIAIVLYEHKEHPRGQRLLMLADGA